MASWMVIAVYLNLASGAITGPLDKEFVNTLPPSTRYLAHCGAGYDMIDVHACSARNPHICVSNVPTAADDATADTNIFLILGALRRFNTGMHALCQGKWRGNPDPPLGHDPQGKTLGVLGMDAIWRKLKKRAEAFGMKVIYHNRRQLDEKLSGGAKYVTFEELLSTSDILSLNIPLNKSTYHIISRTEFARMKNCVVVVNTARGAVVDEAALVEALESGTVFSAGLDIFEEKPRIHPKLLNNQNVILLPHMGAYTEKTVLAMEEWAIESIHLGLTTGKLKSPVPEHADL